MDFSFAKDIILENSRVLLRPLTQDDNNNLLPVATAQTDLVQFSPYQIHTPALLADYIQTSLQEREKGFRYPFAVFDKKAQTYAGSTSIANVSNKDRRLEIGWTWIGRAFQQTGLNRACKALLLSYAFDELEFERVEFKTDARNTASRNAIEKIGGQYEGALRSHTVMLDGFRRDTVYYSILKSEWPGLKKTVFSDWVKEELSTATIT
ncbi:GNAT family N-acetyltransferase [Flavisolibacter sp. BT320]|nr:GNAT family N-acetyltransferase [Flavisolibacter longurius]